MTTTTIFADVTTKQLMIEILSRSNNKDEWERALVSIVKAWAENKSRTEKVNLAAELVDPLVGRANFGLVAIGKVLEAKAIAAGEVLEWDWMGTGEITKVVPKKGN
jgi:hypothetical protein